MPKCTVCSHAQVESINMELMEGVALQKVADKYGLSKTPLHRHKTNHMTGQLAKTQQAQLTARADSVMNQLAEITARANGIFEQASDNPSLALRALKELRETANLCAKLTGELKEAQTVINNNTLVITPEWVSMRSAILRALTPYPEAKQAVIAALGGGGIVQA